MKIINLNNGRGQNTEPVDALEICGLELLRHYMDDDAAEAVAAEMAPCTDLEFLIGYLQAAPADLIIG